MRKDYDVFDGNFNLIGRLLVDGNAEEALAAAKRSWPFKSLLSVAASTGFSPHYSDGGQALSRVLTKPTIDPNRGRMLQARQDSANRRNGREPTSEEARRIMEDGLRAIDDATWGVSESRFNYGRK